MDEEIKPDELILRLIALGAEDASPIIATLPNSPPNARPKMR